MSFVFGVGEDGLSGAASGHHIGAVLAVVRTAPESGRGGAGARRMGMGMVVSHGSCHHKDDDGDGGDGRVHLVDSRIMPARSTVWRRHRI